VALGATGVVAGLYASRRDGRAAPATAVAVSRPAPDFTGMLASRGGRARFSLVALRGHPVLLSFLNTQAEATAANDPSRAELVFLKSMNTQNRPHGLRTVVVDAAAVVGGRPPDRTQLVNFTYDWALDPTIAVVGDASGAIARAYGVARVPTTILLDAQGVVRHRWNGFARAAQLDFAIRPLVGRALVGR